VKKIELKWYGKASKRAIAIFLGYHEKVNNVAADREIYIGPAACACLFAKAAVICVDAAKSGGASLKQAVVVAISAASPMRG
jgi:hypothetical protein